MISNEYVRHTNIYTNTYIYEATCEIYMHRTKLNVGYLKVNKKQVIFKLIECVFQRKDDEMQTGMQEDLDLHGKQSSIEMHTNCYCSYTFKEHIKRFLRKKRKEGRDDAPATRMRRSQVTDFDFRTQCLFCANVCEQINPKHPERWNRVIQCERMGMKNGPPFKYIVLQHCGDRNDI